MLHFQTLNWEGEGQCRGRSREGGVEKKVTKRRKDEGRMGEGEREENNRGDGMRWKERRGDGWKRRGRRRGRRGGEGEG